MTIKNNCVIARNSLGMISPTRHVTPTLKGFVGPLYEEEVCIMTPRDGSPRSLKLSKCPRAVAFASGVFYDVPVAYLGETHLIHAGQRGGKYEVKTRSRVNEVQS